MGDRRVSATGLVVELQGDCRQCERLRLTIA
jgi:hypothetical protein